MRVYLPPAINKFISTLVLIVSLAVAGYLGFKAWQIVSSDPSLQQIPGILEKQNTN